MFDYQSLSTRVGEQEFVVERQFSAPRTLMFQVFTQPEHLVCWWAPQPYTMPICTIDLRPGGIWHYCMRSPEGQDHWARSVYREIVPPEKLVYTSTFADEHANPIEGMPEHLTTVIFTEEAGKTQSLRSCPIRERGGAFSRCRHGDVARDEHDLGLPGWVCARAAYIVGLDHTQQEEGTTV